MCWNKGNPVRWESKLADGRMVPLKYGWSFGATTTLVYTVNNGMIDFKGKTDVTLVRIIGIG